MPVELRPIQALRLWHDVTFDLVRDRSEDLSARQMENLMQELRACLEELADDPA